MEKIIHQIWVGDFKIPLRELEISNRIKSMHDDYQYILWREPPELPDNVQKWYNKFYSYKNYVFCADLLRVYVVYKYGGFYLDIDFDIQKRLDPIFENESILFYHNDLDFTIPNNLIGANAGAKHLEYCITQIKDECSWYGPSWFGATIKQYFNLPYETIQAPVMDALNKEGVAYHQYWEFEKEYGKHLSLYSWEPKTWERLRSNEQL